MEQNKKGSAIMVIIAVVAIVAVGIGLWILFGHRIAAPVPAVPTQTQASSTPRDTVTFLPTVVPYKFPSDFPLYGSTTLMYSAAVKLSGAGIASSRAFSSVKSPKDIDEFYLTYLRANSWNEVISATGTSPIAYSLSGKKGQDEVVITVSVPQKDTKTIVAIEYITQN